jgi:hypothetical protein
MKPKRKSIAELKLKSSVQSTKIYPCIDGRYDKNNVMVKDLKTIGTLQLVCWLLLNLLETLLLRGIVKQIDLPL